MSKWAMAIDLDKCVACQACTVACKAENNVPYGSPEEQRRQREIYWHKVIAVSSGSYPSVRIEFIPMPCMHCANPPCVKVCPAKATYKREDGIVVQNFRRCIGCKYCIVACPYGVRSFNYKEQKEQEYHRPDQPPERNVTGPWPFPHRLEGVVEKCTFCYHRIDKALEEGKVVGVDVVPACVEACPTQARVFGDLDDPESEISRLITSRTWFRLRESLDTEPKVFYLSV